MGFHFTVRSDDSSYTWKPSYANVELICDLENKYGITSELAKSANITHEDCIQLTVQDFIQSTCSMIEKITKIGETLFISYAYKIKPAQSGKYGKATTRDWMYHIRETDQYGNNCFVYYSASFGLRESVLYKWTTVGDEQQMPTSVDLSGYDEYELPDGSFMKIVRKILKDTLTPELEHLLKWLQSRPKDEEVVVESG